MDRARAIIENVSLIKPLAPAIFLIVLVALGVFLAERANTAEPRSSVEVHFADASPSGLSIVPASCPSDPHPLTSGDCTCTLTASDSAIVRGQSTTLSWTITDAQGLIFGSITPSIGAVVGNGSRRVTPTQTTTYTLSSMGGFSCARTVTVRDAVCTGGGFARASLCANDDRNLSTDTSTVLVSSCGERKCQYVCNEGYKRSGDRCVPYNNCSFNGKTVRHGESVTAYRESSVLYNSSCSSQIRRCDNGTLSGTYAYSSCSVGNPANCSFNGQVVRHGENVTAYREQSVPYNSSCSSQIRRCDNGTLSGTYAYSSCSVGDPANCTFNGQVVRHGENVTAYREQSVPYNSSCSSQTRRCDNGTLSGSYAYGACTVQPPPTYSLSGVVWVDADGDTRVDSPEERLAARTVVLTTASGVAVGSATTNSTGTYSFTGLQGGTYRVSHTVPSGYRRTTDDSVPITIGSNTTYDFGVQRTPTPSCSLTLDRSSVAYGSGTRLRWSSTDATTLHISNIGYVFLSGSTNVAPDRTTTYTGTATGSGGMGSCTAALTVTAPMAPSASISADSPTIRVGQSTIVRASFSANSGDTLTAANIDQPLGSGRAASTSPSPKTYVFAPSSTGTYTFYARATSHYYSAWATYAQTSVTVTDPPPSCTVTAQPSTVVRGSPALVSWNSTFATSFTLATIGSVAPNTAGSATVYPQSTTSYGGTATGTGGSAQCPATVSVICVPLYSCSGNTVLYTDASCATSTVRICPAPTYCTAGQSSCTVPPVGSGGGIDEDPIVAQPAIVSKDERSTVIWDVDNAESCTVQADNGDRWTGASGSRLTRELLQQSVYTIVCDDYDADSVENDFEASVTIIVPPEFEEL